MYIYIYYNLPRHIYVLRSSIFFPQVATADAAASADAGRWSALRAVQATGRWKCSGPGGREAQRWTEIDMCITHGALNVPIEHHPTIRYMVYNGYYQVMSNIPKMGQLPTPVIYSYNIHIHIHIRYAYRYTCTYYIHVYIYIHMNIVNG